MLPFFGVELLHCRLTDFHQVTAKRVPNTVTYSNLSPVAHEISSGEAPKGGKFEDNSCLIFPSYSYPLNCLGVDHLRSHFALIFPWDFLFLRPGRVHDTTQLSAYKLHNCSWRIHKRYLHWLWLYLLTTECTHVQVKVCFELWCWHPMVVRSEV